MSDKQLTIVTDPPSMVIAGSDQDYGFLEKKTIAAAINDGRYVSDSVDVAAGDSDEVKNLKRQVQKLANTVTELSGQMYQLAHAIETGRIAVFEGD